MKNQFGRVSELRIGSEKSGEGTRLADVFYTAPFKIMQPFPTDRGLQVMMLSASAGVMAGDTQHFFFKIGEGSRLEFISQSFEKIHKMDDGWAERNIEITVEADAVFDFYPQPTIPFAGSAYQSGMEVNLTDETSRFGLYEILSCGRSASGERFKYRFYHSLIQIRRRGKLIYRDNTRYEPERMEMEGVGMYESYTHLANLFLTANRVPDTEKENAIRSLVEKTPYVEGGFSRLESDDVVIRILGKRAQTLQQLTEKIKQIAE
ncbi:MAG: urease accessory protein UreD [Ruminococcus sp.]|jgi:urease accessory protein